MSRSKRRSSRVTRQMMHPLLRYDPNILKGGVQLIKLEYFKNPSLNESLKICVSTVSPHKKKHGYNDVSPCVLLLLIMRSLNESLKICVSIVSPQQKKNMDTIMMILLVLLLLIMRTLTRTENFGFNGFTSKKKKKHGYNDDSPCSSDDALN